APSPQRQARGPGARRQGGERSAGMSSMEAWDGSSSAMFSDRVKLLLSLDFTKTCMIQVSMSDAVTFTELARRVARKLTGVERERGPVLHALGVLAGALESPGAAACCAPTCCAPTPPAP